MWKIHAQKAMVYQAPSASAPVIAELSDGSTVRCCKDFWLIISYARQMFLAGAFLTDAMNKAQPDK